MNKLHRTGINTSVAFSSDFKNTVSLSMKKEKRGYKIITNFFSKIRRYLKKIAKVLIRSGCYLIKPIIMEIILAIKPRFIAFLRNEFEPEFGKIIKQTQEVISHVRGLDENIFSSLSCLQRVETYSCISARRALINCDNNEVLVRTKVGFIFCSVTDYAVIVSLMEAGELEPGTSLLIQRLLEPGDTFLDIGANLGLHTIAAARALEGSGKVIAFEPYEPTKKLLEKSVWLNGFSHIAEIHQAAVFNIEGSRALFLGATSGHHSLYPLDVKQENSQTIKVPVVKLDDIISPNDKVNLVKIDVEGAELEVLESGASILANNYNIALIVEFGPSHLKRTGHELKQWFAGFEKFGLFYQVINEQTGYLEDWPLEKLYNATSVNLLFSRKDSSVWDKLSYA